MIKNYKVIENVIVKIFRKLISLKRLNLIFLKMLNTNFNFYIFNNMHLLNFCKIKVFSLVNL